MRRISILILEFLGALGIVFLVLNFESIYFEYTYKKYSLSEFEEVISKPDFSLVKLKELLEKEERLDYKKMLIKEYYMRLREEKISTLSYLSIDLIGENEFNQDISKNILVDIIEASSLDGLLGNDAYCREIWHVMVNSDNNKLRRFAALFARNYDGLLNEVLSSDFDDVKEMGVELIASSCDLSSYKQSLSKVVNENSHLMQRLENVNASNRRLILGLDEVNK